MVPLPYPPLSEVPLPRRTDLKSVPHLLAFRPDPPLSDVPSLPAVPTPVGLDKNACYWPPLIPDLGFI
jgi:hypothetical protein